MTDMRPSGDPDDVDELDDAGPAVERGGTAGGDPRDALAAALAAWARRPGGYRALQAAALPHLDAVASDVAGVRAALDAGDAETAAGAAVDAMAREAEPARREALRAAAAVAVSALDPDAPRRLFAAGAGWSASAPLGVAAALSHLSLAKSARAWERTLIEGLYRHGDEPLRLAAIETQVMIARRVGIAPAPLRRLLMTLMRERGAGRFGQAAAELIWIHGAPAFVQPLFGRFGGLVAAAAEDPLLARLLRRGAWHRAPAVLRDAARAGAARLERVERDTAKFWARLGDPAVRVAVVGNSPCETGRGRGAAIDAHDVVVRFNDAPEDGSFAADYGVRCDAKVLAVSHVRADVRTAAPIVVFRRQPLVVSRRMAFADAYAGRGAEVVYVPTTLTATLRGALRQPASSGLAVLAQIRDVRGSLANVSCFGFSLTDQLAPGAEAHYFDRARSNDAHAWRAERALFDAWTGGR